MTFAIGSHNSAFGFQALDNVSGTYNVGMGYRALRFLTSGTLNTAVGGTSSNNIGTGSNNTSIGYGALAFGTPGNANSNNVAIGLTSLWQALGNNNTAIGFYSGRFIANGSTAATAIDNSILIGYNTKVLANSQTNQIVIGYDETGLGSNTTIIGNSSTITTALRGNLLLGTTTDTGQKLQVTGTAIISSTATLTSLSGTGSRMVVADSVGELSTAAIPNGTVTSVGLSMPTAFTVTNSPVTGADTLTVTGAGLVSQYIRGDGTLANFPNSTGGGSSVNYYLNGSVNQGTFGGDVYYQMSKTPVFGAGTNFTRTNGSGNGYIASFITDVADPSQLNIPGGNWNVEFYFQASSGGGNPSFYAELYKVSAANVFTLIASDSANPEGITNGTTVDQYFTSIPVPQTTLVTTDRLAIRIFVNTGGRTITLHTENGNLSEVLTTFTTGLTALNGLTTQVQNFGVGTTGTDFNISSVTDTHTFNLPTASATNRGALSSADWTAFNNKVSSPIRIENINSLFSPNAGVGSSAQYSFFIGPNAGQSADDASYSNFLGYQSGFLADFARSSNFLGNAAGSRATNASNCNFFGFNTGASFTGNNVGENNIIIGTNVSLPDGATNSINLGGVLFAADTYYNLGGNPSIVPTNTGRVGIGIVAPDPSAKLDISSDRQGLLIPRMNTSSRNNISAPAIGLEIYNTDINAFQYWNGTVWLSLESGGNIYNSNGSLTSARTLTLNSQPLTIAGTTSSIFHANGNVGIGTTLDSGFKLHVIGSSKITGEFRIGVRPGMGGEQMISFTHSDVYNTINSASWTFFQSSYGLFLGAGNGQNVYLGVNNIDQLSNVGIGYFSWQGLNASAILDIKSTNKGILIPRMDTTQRDNIITPATGLQIYNTTTNTNQYWNGTSWVSLSSSSFSSLTVTGNSGASSLISGVLNVPTYTLSGLGGQPLATNLTSLSALTYASTSFVKMTAAGTFALDTNTYLTSVGTGTTNQLTYWSGTNTLGSLSTTTYPSLTELSYLKGVTSSIQSQFVPLSGTTNTLPITGRLRTTNDYGVWKQWDGSDQTITLTTGVIRGTTSTPSTTQAQGIHKGYIVRYYDPDYEGGIEIAESILESAAYSTSDGATIRAKIYAQSIAYPFSALSDNAGRIIVDASRGLLGAANYSSFYTANSFVQKTYVDTQVANKQNLVSLTTTGTSGAATFNQTTGALNIPNYVASGGMAIGGAITSATAGSILFAGTSGVLAQDNANLFWNDANNRLGIGTALPESPLHVVDLSNTQYVAVARLLAPNQAINGRYTQSYLGVQMTTRNSAAWTFYYAANGSTANYQSFEFNGVATPNITMFASGSNTIGGTTDVPTSILTLDSTSKGFLIPRMTATQRNNIGGAFPATGLQIYNTDTNINQYYNGTVWRTPMVILTTTGVSGAATYTADTGTLNIPQYSSPITVQNTNSLFSAALSAGGSSTSQFSVLLGQNAGNGIGNTAVSNLVFIGQNAGQNAIQTQRAVFIGEAAGQGATSSQYSIYIGAGAGAACTSSAESICIGLNAGGSAASTRNSIIIGARAGFTFTGNQISRNNIIIGTGVSLPNASLNSMNIGGVLFGANLNDTTAGNPSIVPTATGRIGVGVVAPTANLHIKASTTAAALMRLEVGAAPTTPNDGDIWLESNTQTGLKIRLAGVTRTFTLT
jgi:hypothetical protein